MAKTKEQSIKDIYEKGIPKIFQQTDPQTCRDFMELMSKYQDVIVNIEEGHYKFWTYVQTRSGIKYIWGRIGRTAQEKEKPGDSRWDAQRKMSDKISNGYFPLSLDRI